MQSSLYIQLISDCQYAILSHIIKRLKLSEPDDLISLFWRPGNLHTAALAAVSTPATELRIGGPPPSPRSRRLRPRTASLASLPRNGLDAGGQDTPRPPSPRSRRRRPRSAVVASRLRHRLDAGSRGPHLWPASLATVSTPVAKICRGLPRRGL